VLLGVRGHGGRIFSAWRGIGGGLDAPVGVARAPTVAPCPEMLGHRTVPPRCLVLEDGGGCSKALMTSDLKP
jgi:hypothetical protein